MPGMTHATESGIVSANRDSLTIASGKLVDRLHELADCLKRVMNRVIDDQPEQEAMKPAGPEPAPSHPVFALHQAHRLLDVCDRLSQEIEARIG